MGRSIALLLRPLAPLAAKKRAASYYNESPPSEVAPLPETLPKSTRSLLELAPARSPSLCIARSSGAPWRLNLQHRTTSAHRFRSLLVPAQSAKYRSQTGPADDRKCLQSV